MRLRSDPHLDFVPHHTHLEAIHLDPRIVAPGTITDAKSPSVPGTGDDPVFDRAARQTGPHVRTQIVDGRVFPVHQKDRHHPTLDGIRHPLALGNLTNFGDSHEIRHGAVSDGRSSFSSQQAAFSWRPRSGLRFQAARSRRRSNSKSFRHFTIGSVSAAFPSSPILPSSPTFRLPLPPPPPPANRASFADRPFRTTRRPVFLARNA